MEVVISKSKSHWKSNDFKITFKIILKYSLYSSNFNVFCLLINTLTASLQSARLPGPHLVSTSIFITSVCSKLAQRDVVCCSGLVNTNVLCSKKCATYVVHVVDRDCCYYSRHHAPYVATDSVRLLWYTMWRKYALSLCTTCAICEHSLSTKNYTKIVIFIYVWLFLG